MSVLNNKPQMFVIQFPSNFWYKEVINTWEPMVKRMKLPYETLDDFMNQQIQQVTLPSTNLELATQQRGQYEIAYATGKELEPEIGKNLNITFKLTESYLSYWVVWHQVDTYLHYANDELKRNKAPIYMEPISLSFLTDAGLEMLSFRFDQIVPTNIGELNLSYAATVASYNTFTWNLRFNYFDIS